MAARKPAQSYSLGDLTDAEILARATVRQPIGCVLPTVPVPVAGASHGGRRTRPATATISALADELNRGWPGEPVDVGVVEGAGGVASPLAIDGDTADLARLAEADLAILVGEPQLGIINSARLTRSALRPLSVAVHLNRFDPSVPTSTGATVNGSSTTTDSTSRLHSMGWQTWWRRPSTSRIDAGDSGCRTVAGGRARLSHPKPVDRSSPNQAMLLLRSLGPASLAEPV